MPLVTDAMVGLAFDWLHDHAGRAAAAKAERIKAEYGTKRVRAKLFLEAPVSTVAEREAWALTQPEFEAAVDREAEAVREDEFHRGERIKCEMLIEAWRSESANLRAMGKVG
jgi:hypothetical protein